MKRRGCSTAIACRCKFIPNTQVRVGLEQLLIYGETLKSCKSCSRSLDLRI